MKVLLYGSAHLASVTCDLLKKHHEVVGHIPSKNPRIPSTMNCRLISDETEYEHDIKLSIQYDQKILNTDNAFNVHTGLLPEWGGCDILYHTLQDGAKEQGITFHKITDRFDYGPIVSKTTYPVIDGDTVFTLYERLTSVLPWFVLSSLQLLETMKTDQVAMCYKEKPNIFFKEKGIKEEDIQLYKESGALLRKMYGTIR